MYLCLLSKLYKKPSHFDFLFFFFMGKGLKKRFTKNTDKQSIYLGKDIQCH